MKAIVVETLVCGNCLNATPLGTGQARLYRCELTGRVVSRHNPFCRTFEGDTSAFHRTPHLAESLAEYERTLQ